MKKRFDLEERLISFGGQVILFTNSIKKDFAGTHLANQLIRSASSPALNYAESQSAESRRDFIHKNKIALKELKETRANLKLLTNIGYGSKHHRDELLAECEELIAIMATVIKNVAP